MSKRLKRLMAEELKNRMEDHDSCVVVGVGPMTVENASELRNELREKGVALTVVKNRVARHALADLGWEGVGELLSGSSAVAYGEGGALAASKVLVDWEKKTPDAILIQGGMLEGKILDTQAVRQLATIPDKPVLYSMLAAAVAAPVTQVATLVGDILAGVARAVGAVAEKQGGDEE
jgi:large subunit ribosomal protein L10